MTVVEQDKNKATPQLGLKLERKKDTLQPQI